MNLEYEKKYFKYVWVLDSKTKDLKNDEPYLFNLINRLKYIIMNNIIYSFRQIDFD